MNTLTETVTLLPEESERLQAQGLRRCTRCHEIKPLETDFYCFNRETGKRRRTCRRCEAATKARWYATHRNSVAASLARWRKANRSKTRGYYTQWREGHPEEHKARLKAWRERNAEYTGLRNRAIKAVEDGKRSPITRRTGFSVVQTGDTTRGNTVRAARLDRPIQRGEVVICQFEWSAAAGRWIVLSAPVRPALGGQAELHARVTGYFQRKESK